LKGASSFFFDCVRSSFPFPLPRTAAANANTNAIAFANIITIANAITTPPLPPPMPTLHIPSFFFPFFLSFDVFSLGLAVLAPPPPINIDAAEMGKSTGASAFFFGCAVRS
jgi:hypothetical protein